MTVDRSPYGNKTSQPDVLRQEELWRGLLEGFARRVRIDKSDLTAEGYVRVLAGFQRYLHHELGAAGLGPGDYTIEHVEHYVLWLRERGRKRNTQRNHISALHTFEHFLLDRAEISSDRLARLPWPKLERPEIEALPIDDLRRVVQGCKGRTLEDRRDYALMVLIVHCGARTSEVANLDRGDIDLEQRTVLFHGKGSHDYVASLYPKAVDALDAYLWMRRDDGERALFISVRGRRKQRLTRSGIFRMVQRRGLQVGLEGLNIHAIRRTVGTMHKRSGMRDDEMSRVMGWMPGSRMPDHYTAASLNERAIEAHRKHSLLDEV